MNALDIVCEYRGVAAALQSVGLRAIAVWSAREEEVAALDGLPGAFIALTLPEDLDREPRWAWLSSGVHVLHLPNANELEALFAGMPAMLPLTSERAWLLHPLGQWQWAAERFVERLPEREEAMTRLAVLWRFAARRWPQMEGPLIEIGRLLGNGDDAGVRRMMAQLLALSGDVAVVGAVEPLFHNGERSLVRKVGPVRSMLLNGRPKEVISAVLKDVDLAPHMGLLRRASDDVRLMESHGLTVKAGPAIHTVQRALAPFVAWREAWLDGADVAAPLEELQMLNESRKALEDLGDELKTELQLLSGAA